MSCVKLSDVFISLVRNPIHIIVTTDSDKLIVTYFILIRYDKKIKVKNGDPLEIGSFVKATLLSKSFIDKDVKIMALGRLDDVANKEDIEEFYGNEYTRSEKLVDFDDYVKKENHLKKLLQRKFRKRKT